VGSLGQSPKKRGCVKDHPVSPRLARQAESSRGEGKAFPKIIFQKIAV
jgi:hypothetical protein